MGLFDRKPKFQDDALNDLAHMFISSPNDPTPGSGSIDPSKLDFTVESLRNVDVHLEIMRGQNLGNQELVKYALRCGAYVGEVIRRNSRNNAYHWLDYKSALKLEKKMADFGESLGTAAILWDNMAGFNFPIAKVVKYLTNGSEDSVYYFAKVILSKAEEEYSHA
jgi:hypothetical protein